MKYIYPVVFTHAEEGGYLISFPDFPHIHTDGESLADAFSMAEDALNLWLWHAEEKSKEIPVPTSPRDLAIADDDILALIKADTAEYRKHNDTQAVKKTLSIPRWLDTLAKERNVNFSNVLQNALMNELNVSEGHPK